MSLDAFPTNTPVQQAVEDVSKNTDHYIGIDQEPFVSTTELADCLARRVDKFSTDAKGLDANEAGMKFAESMHKVLRHPEVWKFLEPTVLTKWVEHLENERVTNPTQYPFMKFLKECGKAYMMEVAEGFRDEVGASGFSESLRGVSVTKVSRATLLGAMLADLHDAKGIDITEIPSVKLFLEQSNVEKDDAAAFLKRLGLTAQFGRS